VNAQDLLEQADRLLNTVVHGTRGRWPRACATLIRLALEKALDDFWAVRLPEAKNCSMRAQLLLLPRYAGAEVAGDARDAWFGLARATHHHAYELAPTAGELRTWYELVSKITSALSASVRLGGPS
jgi:hypothetical protein